MRVSKSATTSAETNGIIQPHGNQALTVVQSEVGRQVIRQEVGQTPTGQADKRRQVQRRDVSSEGHNLVFFTALVSCKVLLYLGPTVGQETVRL